MSLSENTLNNLFRKKIGITLHFSSDYSLENNEINCNFAEFLEFVDQNIVFWSQLDPKYGLIDFSLFWKNIKKQIESGFEKASKHPRKDRIEQLNDILSELTLDTLYSIEVQEVEDNTKIISRSLEIYTPNIQDKNIGQILDFIQYSHRYLSKLDETSQLDASLKSYIRFTKNPQEIFYNLSSGYAYQNAASLYCLRNLILETEISWSKISEETIKSHELILESSLNTIRKQIFLNKNSLEEIEGSIERERESLNSLESAYKEKLKLEAPENLWNEQAEKYNEDANLLIFLTLFISFIFIIILGTVLPMALETQHGYSILSPAAILVASTSFVIYFIRVLIKQIQSCKHLQIVCTERAALTRFYQALIYQDGPETIEDEKPIIFRALFEVADTGLVKNSGTESLDGLLATLMKKT